MDSDANGSGVSFWADENGLVMHAHPCEHTKKP